MQSTGDVIASLGGTLKDLMPNTDAFDLVQKTIEDESRRRDEALAVQNKLIEEQITNLRARTDALNRGEAMIKIDGAGLQLLMAAKLESIANDANLTFVGHPNSVREMLDLCDLGGFFGDPVVMH